MRRIRKIEFRVLERGDDGHPTGVSVFAVRGGRREPLTENDSRIDMVFETARELATEGRVKLVVYESGQMPTILKSHIGELTVRKRMEMFVDRIAELI